MSLADAAKLLDRSPDYLRVAVSRGTLKAVKIGNSWGVEAEEVERYAVENLGKRGRPKTK